MSKFFKTVIIIMIIALVICIGIYFGLSDEDNNSKVKSKVEKNIEDILDNPINNFKKYNAEDIINLLKENNLPIGRYVIYTEENDINNLLGRPNQYTSKVNFEDIRIEQNYIDDVNDVIGGSIEVFNNEEDLEKRKSYIESVTSSMSFLVEYDYSNKYVLLRLAKELTPSQVEEYKNVLDQIMD